MQSAKCKFKRVPILNFDFCNFGDLVKSLKRRISVIPANPGSGPGQAPESSYFKYFKILWTPVFTGVTTFYENINFHFAIGNAFMIMFSDLERWRKS
jgi:hypothetical protein